MTISASKCKWSSGLLRASHGTLRQLAALRYEWPTSVSVQALITLHACQHPVIKAGGAAKRDALRSKQVSLRPLPRCPADASWGVAVLL